MPRQKVTPIASTAAPAIEDHDEYESLLISLEENYARLAKSQPVYTTEPAELYDAIFIESLPTQEMRQHHNCRACREFVNKYGGLVTIDAEGRTHSALWDADNAPGFFKPIVRKMGKQAERLKVTGVFLSSETTWGKPETSGWHHMAIKHPAQYKSLVLSASQRMAELAEDYKMLVSALREYPMPTVASALTLLRSEQLYRSEKVLGVAEWLYALQSAHKEADGSRQIQNLTWRSVATAPAGFCHVKSSMIGTLLDDIQAGLPMHAVKMHFDLKMNPLQYQRPQAAPAQGNIEQAEKLVEKLGIERSLLRRFARIEEIKLIWSPKSEHPKKPAGGVFAHLTPKDKQPERAMSVSNPNAPIKITWAKFARTVLPDAVSIQYYTHAIKRDNFCALVTAVDLDAPAIMQWDSSKNRNPFSTYVYHGGSIPVNWNLTPGWVDVTGITLSPSHWNEESPNHKNSAILILRNAKDVRYQHAGLAIFPETLVSSLHSIRSTIEAYSRKGTLEGYEEASACGVALDGSAPGNTLRVKTNIGITDYNIDRWE